MGRHPVPTTDALDFAGQTVVITGAAAGLGKAYAEYIGALGGTVILTDLHPGVSEVAAGITRAGGHAEAIVGNIADAATSAACVDRALALTGKVSAIINNAGVGFQRGFAETDLADFQRLLDIHYFGTLHLCRAAWPHMVAAGYGRIVNIVSATLYGFDGWSAYGASKGAVFGLSRSMAVEGEPLGIRINMISPGAGTALAGTVGDPELFRAMVERMPPAAVASTVAYLAHPVCERSGTTLASGGSRLSDIQFGATTGVILPDSSLEAVVARDFDYRVKATALQGEDGVDRIVVPIWITGPWDAPRVALDMEAIAQERLGEQAKAAEDELRRRAAEELDQQEGESLEDAAKRKLQEQVDEQAGKLLEQLLGGN